MKALGLVLGLGLFGWVITGAVSRTQSVDWPPVPLAHIVLAFCVVIVARGLHAAAWVIGARQIAPRLDWVNGMAIYSVSFLGRYIPGKIWQIGGLAYLARNRGADAVQVAGYSLAFMVAFQVVGALILLAAILTQDFRFGWVLCVVAAGIIAVVLAVLYKVSSEWVFNRLPGSWRKQLQGSLHQPLGALWVNLSLMGATWLLLATCGYLMVLGFQPTWAGTWGQSAAASLGGFLIGFLVLITPSGAGVREAAIAVGLGQVGVEPAVAIVTVIALRVVMTAGELLWALIGLAQFYLTSTDPRRT